MYVRVTLSLQVYGAGLNKNLANVFNLSCNMNFLSIKGYNAILFWHQSVFLWSQNVIPPYYELEEAGCPGKGRERDRSSPPCLPPLVPQQVPPML